MEQKEFEEFASNDLYRLAGSYARRNPIARYEYEDYVQELVGDVWMNIGKYDATRGALTTFCYQRFRLVRIIILNQLAKRLETVSLDDFVGDDGAVLRDFVADRESDIISSLLATELLAECGPMTQSWFNGFTQAEIAIKFKVTQGTVSNNIKKDIKNIKKLVEDADGNISRKI